MLGKDLRPDYLVQAPRMPQPTNPEYRTWARRIAELIADTTNPVLVGHSFGASVLLKYLVHAALGGRLRDLSPLYLYHSRDDPEVPFADLERYSRALPQAIVRALDGRGHEFNQAHFPELAADIRSLEE